MADERELKKIKKTYGEKFMKMCRTNFPTILEVDDKLCHLKLSIKNIMYIPHKKHKKRKIQETPLGFKTLSYKLPKWIEKSIESARKKN